MKVATTVDRIVNLVEDFRLPELSEGTSWHFEGDCAVAGPAARNVTRRECIRFTGSGRAVYTCTAKKTGLFTLRFFAYDVGHIDRADAIVRVDDIVTVVVPYIRRGWWMQRASDTIEVPFGACVEVAFEVSGEPGLRFDVDEVELLEIPEIMEPVAGTNPVSCLAKREDGTYYIEIKGWPSLHHVAHAHSLTDMSLTDLALKIKQAGYAGFIKGISWLEMQPDNAEQYDFRVIDDILAACETHDMFCAFSWMGSGFCGNIKMLPYWLRDDMEIMSMYEGKPETLKGGYTEDTRLYIADYNNPKLLEYEMKAFQTLMDYIEENDVHQRIVSIQIENEAGESIYASQRLSFEQLTAHINEFARIVKESGHAMVTRVNHGFGSAPFVLYNTSYIDINGSDPYTDNVEVTEVLLDRFNSRVPHLAENGGYRNASAHLAVTFAQGGWLAPYPVDHDTYWDRPGLYGRNFEVAEHTERLSNLGHAALKMEPFLVLASDVERKALNAVDPQEGLREDSLRGCAFEYQSADGHLAVATFYKGSLYCISDGDFYIALKDKNVEYTASYGYVDKEGVWQSESSAVPCENGLFLCPGGRVLKLIG